MANRNIKIKELEMRLNTYWEFKEENYIVKISDIDEEGIITLLIIDGDDNKLVVKLEAEYAENIENLIRIFISEIYENYISSYESNINSWNQFIIRKVGSLKLWTEKGNQDKVNEITLDIVEKYNSMINEKNEQGFYKIFVHMFSAVKSDLEGKIA